jgi:hypothetical protein
MVRPKFAARVFSTRSIQKLIRRQSHENRLGRRGAGGVLFPEGDHQRSAGGWQAINQYIPRLQDLQNAKVVVYGLPTICRSAAQIMLEGPGA